PKKKARSRTIGPPPVPPYWLSRKNGAEVLPAVLSRLVRAFTLLFWWKTNPDPWNTLVPLLVITFITDPAERPYSAANWLVMRRASCTMSVLLIGCETPVTLGSLLS